MIILSEKQQAIINTIKRIGPSSLLRILKESVGFDSKREVETIMGQLVARGCVTKQSNGYFKLAGGEKVSVKSNVDTVKPSKPKTAKAKAATKTKTTAKKARTVAPPTAALDKLEVQLKGRQISNQETKVQTLDRLSKLLDPSIAAVLLDIKNDIQEAA